MLIIIAWLNILYLMTYSTQITFLCGSPTTLHKCTGDEGSDSNSKTLHPSHQREVCPCHVRQHNIISHVKRQCGTHSLSLFHLTQQLFQWSVKDQVKLRVKIIPGRLNAMQDLFGNRKVTLSRSNDACQVRYLNRSFLFVQVSSRYICDISQSPTFYMCEHILQQ